MKSALGIRIALITIICFTSCFGNPTFPPVPPAEVSGYAVSSCPVCETKFCPNSPSDCIFGVVKDQCHCCPFGVCQLREHEKCLNGKKISETDMNKYGSCGDSMECQLRTDLRPEDPPESLCVCKDTRTACGSDNTTYHSICQMRESGIELEHWGPCTSPPEIVSGPADTISFENKRFALDCEVKGYPVPNVFWEFQAFNGGYKSLPGDDPTIGVQNRGGPESYMITSWVQIEELRPSDAGIYICVAKNSEGIVRATATVHLAQGLNESYDVM